MEGVGIWNEKSLVLHGARQTRDAMLAHESSLRSQPTHAPLHRNASVNIYTLVTLTAWTTRNSRGAFRALCEIKSQVYF